MSSNVTNLPQTSKSSVPSTAANARLAQELAAGLTDIPEILERFDLTKAQLARIVKDSHFQSLYTHAKQVWNGIDNVEERIRAKSLHLLEDSVLPLYGIIHNADMAPAARIEAFAKLMKIADMEPKKDQEKVSDKFVVNITLPGREPVVFNGDTAKVIEPDE